MLLKDKVAIVTGGARGIGKGIALKFAEEGCSVAIADIREEEGNQTLKEMAAKGPEGIFIKCDTTDAAQVKAMVDAVIAKFKKIDILVNNAGAFGVPMPVTDVTESLWDKTIDLNLKGPSCAPRRSSPA
jgi:3-oxoacyl-[acyl-carrier protein] reductase